MREHWTTYEDVEIFRVSEAGAYSYVTRHVAIDADGAPRAYHPDGRPGLDALGNAGYPGGGWRSVLVADPADPGRPYVQPLGANAGFFVSKTSLTDPRLPATDPAKYVDAATVPYLVFPGGFYAIRGTGHWGDLAMVRNLDHGQESAAIIADGGPFKAPLGEISIALAAALGGSNPDPRTGRGAPQGAIQYVVFPGSRAEPAWRRDWTEIAATARGLLERIGGWPRA